MSKGRGRMVAGAGGYIPVMDLTETTALVRRAQDFDQRAGAALDAIVAALRGREQQPVQTRTWPQLQPIQQFQPLPPSFASYALRPMDTGIQATARYMREKYGNPLDAIAIPPGSVTERVAAILNTERPPLTSPEATPPTVEDPAQP